ncbi:MAG: transcriptional repressor LexA [Anaerolineales bacterium]|nr:transcriptional repressor LexA [Anaerolineales bacterium]
MMARKRAKGLSERQKRILEVLERYQSQAGYPPSIREICEKTGISSTSVVNYYLDQLQEMRYIERDDHVSRGIRLVKPLSEAGLSPALSAARQSLRGARQAIEDVLRIPIVGPIFASEPVPMPTTDFSYYDSESMVEVARSMLPRHEKGVDDLFALEVQGDSMIDAMVNDGDIVIMKRAHEARNGEMVAVWLADREETTLKYFYLENGQVRLQPANPTLSPIYVKDPSTVEIQGKVVMVIRQVPGLAA